VDGIQKAADLASQAGIRIVNEIHPSGIVETADSALDFNQRVDRPNVGLIFDPGNMYLAGTPFGAGEVYKLWGRIFHVHVKDCLRVSDTTYPTAHEWRGGLIAHRVMGEGAVDHLPSVQGARPPRIPGISLLRVRDPLAEQGGHRARGRAPSTGP